MARSKLNTRRPVPRNPYSDSHTGSSVYMGYGPSFDDGHPQELSTTTSATSTKTSPASFKSPAIKAKGGDTIGEASRSAAKTPLVRNNANDENLLPAADSTDDTKNAKTKSANTGLPGPAKALPSPPDPSGLSATDRSARRSLTGVRSDGHDGDARAHDRYTLECTDRTRAHPGPGPYLPSPLDPSGHSESNGGAKAAGNAVRSDGHDGDARAYARQEHNTLERVDRTRPHPGTASCLPSPVDPSDSSAKRITYQFPLGGPSGPSIALLTAREQSALTCAYCRRLGHTTELGCPRLHYRLHGKCVFCGGDHRGEKCEAELTAKLFGHYAPPKRARARTRLDGGRREERRDEHREEPQVHGKLFGDASPRSALREQPARAALRSHAHAQAQSAQQAPRTREHVFARVHERELSSTMHGELSGDAGDQRALREQPAHATLHSHAQTQAHSAQRAPRTQKRTIARAHERELTVPLERYEQLVARYVCGARVRARQDA